MARFQYFLARELGMTRSELLRRMSVRELVDWMAYYTLENADRERAQQDAEDRAKAQQMARSLAGGFRG
jgi:hypothetical protein